MRTHSLNDAFRRYGRAELLGASELTPGWDGTDTPPPFEDTEAVQQWMRGMAPRWIEWWMSDQAVARGYTEKQNQLVFDELYRVIESPGSDAFKHLYDNAHGNMNWAMAYWDHLPTRWVEPATFNADWTLEREMRYAAYQLPWMYYPYEEGGGAESVARVARTKELQAKLLALVSVPGTKDYDALAAALQSGTALEWLQGWLGD